MQLETIIGREFPIKVIPLVEAAKKSIKIVVFDWRWYPNDIGNATQLFNQSILRAKKRGVEIKVISNMQTIVNILRENGIVAKKLSSANLMHVKLMIIDDEILVIGSHNYTQNAFTINYEISVILRTGSIEIEEVKKQMTFFDALFNSN